MRCEHVRSRLAIFADGELRGAELNEVAAHLDTCAACHDEYAEVQLFLVDAREALAPPEADYTFSELKRRMELITPLDEVRAFLPKLRAQGPFGQLAAAALFIAIIIATPFVQRGARQAFDSTKTPFETQLTRLDYTYTEFLGEDIQKKQRS